MNLARSEAEKGEERPGCGIYIRWIGFRHVSNPMDTY